MTEDRFEKYLLVKCQFLRDMLLIVHNELAVSEFQIQLDLVEDIIHHYKIIVKGEVSSRVGLEDCHEN